MSASVPEVEEPRWCRPLPLEAIGLSEEQQRQVAAALVPGEEPERGWMRYMRIHALIALRRWLKQRQAAVVVGPEIEPEEPDRLLAIGGFATQLLCASASAHEVEVPLAAWRQTATAPQLALLALVDEDNAVVEFPGAINAAALISEIQKHGVGEDETIELPTALFEGGLERLLRWITLLEPEALPRVGLNGSVAAQDVDRGKLEKLQDWLAELLQGSTLMPLPVVGTRGGNNPVIRLITPQVQRAEDGSAFAKPVCSTPTIWAEAPLAEVVIEKEGKVVWQQLATRHNPIEGPIAWPLAPLKPEQQLTIRLRPWGTPGGVYAVLSLMAPDSTALQNGEKAVRRRLKEKETDQERTTQPVAEDQAVDSEVRGRLLLAHHEKAGRIEHLTKLPKEEELKRAIGQLSQILGDDHPDVAAALNNLSALYHSQGLYSKAEPLCQRALAICEQSLGADHPNTAASINNLAQLYLAMGFHGQSESLYKRLLAIQMHALGPDHPDIAASLRGLANLYYDQALYSQAEPLYQRTLAIREQALGAHHPDTATSLNDLASLYRSQGLFSQAEPLYKRALATCESALGANHPHTTPILNNLALLYRLQGLYSQAEPLYKRALEICEGMYGEEHPHTANCLYSLADLYETQGYYDQAVPLYLRALDIRVETLGAEHPDTAASINRFAWLRLLAARQTRQPEGLGPSVAMFVDSLRARLAWLFREAPLMAAANRRQLPGLHDALEQMPMDMAAIDLEFAQFLLFARLNIHGLLQQIEMRQAEVARLPGVHQALVERLRSLGTALSSTQLQPQHRQQLAAERNDLEAQLYRLLPDLQLSPVELPDVAAALPSLSALIEFQRYTPRNTITLDPDTTPRYLVFILLPGQSLEVIDLGPAPHLEAAIEEALSATIECFADALEAWRELSERLVSPLLARLEGCTSWFLSLDGELHRIPFHCLPLPGHPNHVLVEQIKLRLLTSGRDLLDRSGTQRADDGLGSALVVADPAFDHSPVSSRPDSGGHLPRSRDMGSLKVWPPLPCTAREGKELAELLSADLHTGSAATTIAVQQAQHPLVLHIATHGFFLANQSEAQAGPEQPWLATQGHGLLANFRGEDPLLRSGLVFAGANHPVANPEEDDGYLTAQEAVQLDLQGTELVTLSACDTGRGDVHTGEGVYGLQRALIVAGARSLLLSLWQVPDDATCEFMLRYYTLLKEGLGRFDALVQVQREFRQHTNERWRHPYYWGAWQLIGDGGPIEGL